MKENFKDIFCKCEEIRSLLGICSLLLKKTLTQNVFCAVNVYISQKTAIYNAATEINNEV